MQVVFCYPPCTGIAGIICHCFANHFIADGLCAIDINHKAGIRTDWMREIDLKDSVRSLLDICVRGSPNQGGVVKNIGAATADYRMHSVLIVPKRCSSTIHNPNIVIWHIADILVDQERLAISSSE